MSKVALQANLCYNKPMKSFDRGDAGNIPRSEHNLSERSCYGYSTLILSLLQISSCFPLDYRRKTDMRSPDKHKNYSRCAPIQKNCVRIQYICDYCGETAWETPCTYRKKRRHFCSQRCYSLFRKDLLPKEEHARWQGIGDKQEYHRRYVKRHPERISHLKARRYAREKGAEGRHTFEEWRLLKLKFNNKCAICKKEKPLTKDHIIPLSQGGTDFIDNIQPLCRSCNSRKWTKKIYIYDNGDLLK